MRGELYHASVCERLWQLQALTGARRLANAMVAVLGPELRLGSREYARCRALIREMQVRAPAPAAPAQTRPVGARSRRGLAPPDARPPRSVGCGTSGAGLPMPGALMRACQVSREARPRAAAVRTYSLT